MNTTIVGQKQSKIKSEYKVDDPSMDVYINGMNLRLHQMVNEIKIEVDAEVVASLVIKWSNRGVGLDYMAQEDLKE